MWKNDKPESAPEIIIAFVGAGVEFKGTLTYEGTVRIDGRLDGEIRTTGVLQVGEQAVIAAKVTAGSVISKGRITGDVTAAERVRLLAPAVLQGSVQTPVLAIEEGVIFDGSCEMAAGDLRELNREPLRPAGAPKRVTG